MTNVAIVEDNRTTREGLETIVNLSKEFRCVRTCSTAEEALKVLPDIKPDLVLMDIQLPEVSGLEVTKWLKDDPELRAIPVVAVTAFAMKGDEERIREGGCEAYLSKPISVGKFIETIRHFLGNA